MKQLEKGERESAPGGRERKPTRDGEPGKGQEYLLEEMSQKEEGKVRAKEKEVKHSVRGTKNKGKSRA